MPSMRKKIEEYYLQLNQIQDTKQEVVNEEDKQYAAHTVGMHTCDMQLSEQQLCSAINAIEYTQVNQGWYPAQKKLTELLKKHPLRLEVKYLAAKLYFYSYQVSLQTKQLRKAETFIMKCISIEPHNSQFIQLQQDIIQCKQQKKSNYAFLVLLIFGFITALTLVFTNTPKIHSTPPPITLAGQKYSVPITLQTSPQLQGIQFQFSKGTIQHAPSATSNAFSFNFHCRLSSKEYEITELALHTFFLGNNNQELADSYYWFWTEGSMSLRPNENYYYRDQELWHGIEFSAQPQRIQRVEMRVEGIQKYKTAPKAPSTKQIPITWPKGQPAGCQLDIRQRHNRILTQNSAKKITNQSLLLEITNTSQKPLQAFSLQFTWHNSEQQQIAQETHTVILQGEPPLQPQQRMVFLLDKKFEGKKWSFPKPFHQLQIGVVDAK